MAPNRPGRPRKSASSTSTRTSDPLGSFPAPPSFVDSAYGSQSQTQSQNASFKSPLRARTPITKSPRKEEKLAAAQKQALIDGLRLEITNRARTLRAHYARQAASLRERLERRILRVPAALRKLTMAEVIARHEQKLKDDIEAKARKAREAQEAEEARKMAAEAEKQRAEDAKIKAAKKAEQTKTRGVKRVSKEMEEETPAAPIPNKRARNATGQATAATRPTAKVNTTATRRGAPSTTATVPREVLSPKSHNTRAYPSVASPFKSPAKPLATRPTSPLKPSTALSNSPVKPSLARTGAPSPLKAPASPTKAPTVPANVPAVANVGTASSRAKTKATGPTSTAATVKGTRTTSRTGGTVRKGAATTTAGATRRKAPVHVDARDDQENVEAGGRVTRNSKGRGSAASDNTEMSGGTVVVHKPAGTKMSARGGGTVRGAAAAAKAKTAAVAKAAATGSVRGGRTLRKR